MISIPALGNTYCTITMNLKHRSDVSAIAAAMLMDNDEQEILGHLPIGEAVIKLQGRFTRPFQIRIPHMEIPKGSVDDASLIQHMTALTGIVPNSEPELETSGDLPEVSDDELRFLKDVGEHPLSGVVERYKRLRVNRRKGNDRKESCIMKGLSSPVDIPTRSGKVVLLNISRTGRSVLRQNGVEIGEYKLSGGLEHEYWKGKVAAHFEDLGFAVNIEEGDDDFQAAYTDIVLRKNGYSLAIEIETGKSDWRANIRKNLKKRLTKVILAVTNEQAEQLIKEKAEKEFESVSVIPVWHLLEIQNADELLEPSTDGDPP